MNALIVDDEPAIRSLIARILEAEGWKVEEAESAEKAFEKIGEKEWNLICCDVVMGGLDGYSALRHFREMIPNARVILMTGYGTAAGALSAAADGAFDYLLKPFKPDALRTLANEVKESFKSNPQSIPPVQMPYIESLASETDLVGSSEAFIEVMKQVGRVAPTNLPVLITGESGTGKEIVAHALHRRSERADKHFVAVNCGAVPAELIKSELFGHVRGAFTGADKDRAGLFEEADGGTVFLDEITETSPTFQVTLLRAIQENEIRRVGSNRTQIINIRIIAASNRNIEEEIQAGRFRQDLYYRLNAVSIDLPPLRERVSDIITLSHHFARSYQSNKKPISFEPEVIELLEKYPWPGNIRELENAIRRAVALCNGIVRVEDLPERIRDYSAITEVESDTALEDRSEDLPDKEWQSLAQVEGQYVKRVLQFTGYNKQRATRILQVDRKTLDRMIQRHNIEQP